MDLKMSAEKGVIDGVKPCIATTTEEALADCSVDRSDAPSVCYEPVMGSEATVDNLTNLSGGAVANDDGFRAVLSLPGVDLSSVCAQVEAPTSVSSMDVLCSVVTLDASGNVSSCHVCSQAFTEHSLLRQHLLDVHQMVHIPVSTLCSPVLADSAGLAEREKLHAVNDHLDCNEVCSEAFQTKALCEEKQKVSCRKTGPCSRRCETCSETLSNKTQLIAHSIAMHGQQTEHYCSECDRYFPHRQQLNSHNRRHANKQALVCRDCGKSFISTSHLQRHSTIHTGERQFQCSLCDAKFSQRVRLKEHERSHTGDKPFACDTCQRTFTTHSNLARHRKVHSEERNFHCDKCSVGFKSKAAMLTHMRLHTDEKHVCNQCSKTYLSAEQLLVHRRHHTGERPVTCDFCQRGFISELALKSHLMTHTGNYPHTCPHCQAGFTKPVMLAKHLFLVHNDLSTEVPNRLRQCNVCKAVFTSNAHLLEHQRRHNGSRPFVCDQCGKAFAQARNLRRHINTHSKEHEYVCKVCGRAFSDPSVRNRHIKLKHQPLLINNASAVAVAMIDGSKRIPLKAASTVLISTSAVSQEDLSQAEKGGGMMPLLPTVDGECTNSEDTTVTVMTANCSNLLLNNVQPGLQLLPRTVGETNLLADVVAV